MASKALATAVLLTCCTAFARGSRRNTAVRTGYAQSFLGSPDYHKTADDKAQECRDNPTCKEVCRKIVEAFRKKHGSMIVAFKNGDLNGDGAVSNEEFVEECMAAGVSDEDISYDGYHIFKLIDTDANGYASLNGYKRVKRIVDGGQEPDHDEHAERAEQKDAEYHKTAHDIAQECRDNPTCKEVCRKIVEAFRKEHGSMKAAFPKGDRNGDGKVSNEEFVEECLAAGVSDEDISYDGYHIFKLIDSDENGYASLNGYKRVKRIVDGGQESEHDEHAEHEHANHEHNKHGGKSLSKRTSVLAWTVLVIAMVAA